MIDNKVIPSAETATRRLWHGFVMTLGSFVIPAVLAVLLIPEILDELGADAFGFLSFFTVTLVLLSTGDFGIGKATTRYVAVTAPALADRGRHITLASLRLSFIAGAILGLTIFAVAEPIASRYLVKSPEFRGQAAGVLVYLSLSVPMLFASNVLTGHLEGLHWFGISSFLRAFNSSLLFLIPWICAQFRIEIDFICLILLAARWATFLMQCAFAFYLLRSTLGTNTPLPSTEILKYVAWSGVTSLFIPLATLGDRFVIGAVAGIGALGIYSAIQEFANKILLPGQAVARVIFPRMSATSSVAASDTAVKLLFDAYRGVYFMYSIAVIALPALSTFLVRYILGDLADWLSIVLFNCLVIAFAINAFGLLPFVFLEARGRPEVITKYHLIETPVFLCLMAWLVTQQALLGAAMCMLARMVFTVPLFTFLTFRALNVTLAPREKRLLSLMSMSFTAWSCIGVGLSYSFANQSALLNNVLALTIIVSGFLAFFWWVILNAPDRRRTLSLLRRSLSQ